MSKQLKLPLADVQVLSLCEMKNSYGGEVVTLFVLGVGALLIAGIGYLGYKSFPGEPNSPEKNLVPDPHELPEV